MPKIHCRGVGEHYGRPLCGERRTLPAVSRQEFVMVSRENRCGRCADSAWIRGELRLRDKQKISVTDAAAGPARPCSMHVPTVYDIK